MRELIALLNGEPTGILEQDAAGRLRFTYLDTWQGRSDSYPLSLSMPLERTRHEDDAVRPYLEGLLPDSRPVLESWGRRFQVSPRNPFALLSHMGEDCPGAVQFVSRDRYDAAIRTPGPVQWLTEGQVAERLRDLVERHGTGRLPGDHGQFSLSGAQPKTALVHDGRRWGIPSGSTPTTHILKPPAQPAFSDLEVNEHFCLSLASELGMAVPQSWVREFDGWPAIVVERYDRRRTLDGHFERIHQEDMCQALAVPPWKKYENEGGPGAADIASLLLRESEDPGADVEAFIDALTFNWVIAGSDAHAKNYALTLGPNHVRFAPIYDLLSALPYDRQIPYRRVKLAMRVDREYHVWKIGRRQWAGLSGRLGLDADPVLARAAELVAAVPATAYAVAERLAGQGIRASTVDRLAEVVARHGHRCLGLLDAAPKRPPAPYS